MIVGVGGWVCGGWMGGGDVGGGGVGVGVLKSIFPLFEFHQVPHSPPG